MPLVDNPAYFPLVGSARTEASQVFGVSPAMDTYETAVAQNSVVTAGTAPVLTIPFLVMGGTSPALAGISCRTTPGSPCAGVLMLGPVTPAQLATR